MSGSYTPTGPFVNNGAPGIAYGFLNNLETYIGQIDNTTAIVQSGSNSGTATLYQFLQGVVKAALLLVNNYNNGGVQSLTLPVPFAQQFWFTTTGINQISFYNGGSIQSCQVQSAVSATGGSTSNQTLIKAWVSGQCIQPVNIIQTAIAAGANTGLVLMVGY